MENTYKALCYCKWFLIVKNLLKKKNNIYLRNNVVRRQNLITALPFVFLLFHDRFFVVVLYN